MAEQEVKPVEEKKREEAPYHKIVIESNGLSWRVLPPVNIFELREIARQIVEVDKK